MKEQLKSVKIEATFENGKKEKHDFPIGGIVTGEKAYGVESDTGESIAAAIHNMRKSQEAFMQTKEQKEPQGFKMEVTPEQSKTVQIRMFKEGYYWYTGGKQTRHENERYLFFNKPRISWTDWFKVFKEDKLPELTFAEWERIYLPKEFIEPQLIKAGDNRLKLGYWQLAPKVDCRVLSENNYQLLKQAYDEMQLYKELQKPKEQKEPHQEFEKYTLLKDFNWFGKTIPKGSTYEQRKSTPDKYRCFANGNECPHWDLTFMTIKNNPEWFELQKPKSKEQQLYEYFADNHDIQLLPTDIQEIERIIKEPLKQANELIDKLFSEEIKEYIKNPLLVQKGLYKHLMEIIKKGESK